MDAKREIIRVLSCQVYSVMVLIQAHRHREFFEGSLGLDVWPGVALLLQIVVLD